MFINLTLGHIHNTKSFLSVFLTNFLIGTESALVLRAIILLSKYNTVLGLKWILTLDMPYSLKWGKLFSIFIVAGLSVSFSCLIQFWLVGGSVVLHRMYLIALSYAHKCFDDIDLCSQNACHLSPSLQGSMRG